MITADLNKVVVELLQSLLYWQERARALHPAKAKQKKRLVSGLRSVMTTVILIVVVIISSIIFNNIYYNYLVCR